jgi:hypothetical protein
VRSGLFGIEALVHEPSLRGHRPLSLTRGRGDRRRDDQLVDRADGKRARELEAKRRATELPRTRRQGREPS